MVHFFSEKGITSDFLFVQYWSHSKAHSVIFIFMIKLMINDKSMGKEFISIYFARLQLLSKKYIIGMENLTPCCLYLVCDPLRSHYIFWNDCSRELKAIRFQSSLLNRHSKSSDIC